MQNRQHNAIRNIAAYILGDETVDSTQVFRNMERLEMCAEFQAIARFFNHIQREDNLMEQASLTELIKLINDLIEKARRERLIEQVNGFYSRYLFVQRSWNRME